MKRTVHSALILFISAQCCAQTWKPLNDGAPCTGVGPVWEIRAGTHDNVLYAAGSFGLWDGEPWCESVATPMFWNGTEWHGLGEPLTAGYHMAIGMFYGMPVAPFNKQEPGLELWDGTSWNVIPGRPPAFSIRSIQQYEEWLYIAGGGFKTCGGVSTDYVCRWNGNTWERLIEPEYVVPSNGSTATTLTLYKDTIYIGGNFKGSPEYSSRNRCLSAVYGGRLNQVGVGLTINSFVETICVHNDTLWIGGNFPEGNFPGHPRSFLLTYSNGKLEPAHTQPPFRVKSLKSYKGTLYMGGAYVGLDSDDPVWQGCYGLGMIAGGKASCLNRLPFYTIDGPDLGQITEGIRSIEIWNDTLYAGGNFQWIGDTPARNMIYLDHALKDIMALVEGEPTPAPEDNLIFDLQLFPNPVFDSFTIAAPDTMLSVELFDLTGRKALSFQPYTTEATFDISSLADGCYVCIVRMKNGGRVIRRLVKQE